MYIRYQATWYYATTTCLKHAVIAKPLVGMPPKKKGKGKQKKGLEDLESIVSSAENAKMVEETQHDVEGEVFDQVEEIPEAALDFEGLALATAEQEEIEKTERLEPVALEGADPEKELSRKEKKKLKKKVSAHNSNHSRAHLRSRMHMQAHPCHTHAHSPRTHVHLLQEKYEQQIAAEMQDSQFTVSQREVTKHQAYLENTMDIIVSG